MGRGLSNETKALWIAIMDVFNESEKPMTVRQMFYRLVSCGAIPKSEGKGYRPVQRQLVEMRRAGLVPYRWIADSTRWMRKPTSYTGLRELFEKSAQLYRQNYWSKTEVYAEVWLEKDALAGVIYPITSEYDVPLMVTRGYASESFVFEAAEAIRERDKRALIYYLGDFDPSGIDMGENLKKKFQNFGVSVIFERLAVTQDQIREFDLPTRPTKESDTRKKGFELRFGVGAQSVEVDAIPPNTLRGLVREAIEQNIDSELLQMVQNEEETARYILEQMAVQY